MSENDHDKTETTPPHVELVQMATAHFVSHIVYAAAKLGLADYLATTPKSAEELAAKTRTHAPSLFRLMRALANLGILTENGARCFALTRLGEALKTGAPGSARAAVLTFASDWWVRGFGHLLYSVETGKSGFEKSLGMPYFDWLAKHPEEASMFSESMACVHEAESAAVIDAYDFSGLTTIVDIGGATGKLLTAILGKYPGSRGILFDLPHVVCDAPRLIQAWGLSDRVMVDAGNFFERVPSGGDAYLLSHIIHDWAEDQCLSILRNCRQAMNPRSRLLIIETVLPADDTPHPGKMVDIVMLVAPGGQERTEQEYHTLLSKAGLRLTRVVPTESPVSVVEAVVAQEVSA
jgi:O-methyltransferase domain/Dimerisation domain